MSKRRRPRFRKSSRVSEKVMEYYLKFGKDRELEKFMRFRSPAGSQKSTTSVTTSSMSSSEEWARMGSLGCLFHEKELSSEERMVKFSHKTSTSSSSSSSIKEQQEHFVPIQIEGIDPDQINVAQSPKTPVRNKELCTETKQTQTPESAAKTHKRLEWDSLADVGYKKSKSTSNISIVERMLLREFFEVSSNAPKTTNSSESDIRLLEQEIANLGTLKKHFTKHTTSIDESKYGTPPLASSTRVDLGERLINKNKEKKMPKLQNVGTNTSLQQEKIEKYVQTSLKCPEMTSQEVQVTLTPPGVSPLLGSSAEPSSFEYRSHFSTNSSDPKSTELSAKRSERPKAGETSRDCFDINEVLEKQKEFLGQNDKVTFSETCERLKQIFRSWNKAMGDDKENTSTSSSCSNAETNSPQIDLGIQLICGIMKAKNIEEKQKKRLVRNIIKRITNIANSCELDAIVSRTATLIKSNPGSCKEMNVASKKQEHTISISAEEQKAKKGLAPSRVQATKKQQGKIRSENLSENIISQTPLSSKNAIKSKGEHSENLTTASSTSRSIEESNTDIHCLTKSSSSTSTRTKSHTHKYLKETQKGAALSETNRVKFPSKSCPATTDISHMESESKHKNDFSDAPTSNLPGSLSSTSLSSESSKQLSKMLEISLCISKGVCTEKVILSQPQIKESTTTSTTTSRTPDSKTSSSSKDLPTQKSASAGSRAKKSNTVTDKEETMQEWLDPITQSEIEYEDNKRKSGSDKKEGRKSRCLKSRRNIQLSWIDSEIERLQQLKNILINDETSTSTESENQSQNQQPNSSATTQASEKLYDTVYSDESKSRSQTISPPKKEMKAVTSKNSKNPQPKCSEFKSVLKPLTTNEESTEKKNEQQKTHPQRSKIDTPRNTNEKETVGSFVRQRKQEFLDHYKNQKLNHYDNLMHKYDEGPGTSAAVAASSVRSDIGGHYSVPVAIQFRQPVSYYTYPPMQQTYRDPCYYTQTLAPATTTAKRTSSNVPTKTSHGSSSELSVPMGSYNTTSTETTTHQYDVAAPSVTAKPSANAGSQTGNSLLRSWPIYQTRCASPNQVCTMMPCSNYVACTDVARSACIQARPKGIAYSLQFIPKSVRSKPDGGESESSTENNELITAIDNAAAPSLQVALERGKPEFLMQAKKRKSVLNRIQKLRQERENALREIADDNTSINSLDRKLNYLPPPVTGQLRLLSTKQMKALTNKKASKLPEVVRKKEKEREERRRKSNRLLREVFNRRLRERVREGKITLNHSLQLI